MNIFSFKGFGDCDSRCGLDFYRLSDGRCVVLATELPDNDGTSVTNMAEYVANQVCRDHDIDPQNLVWIEHYPHDDCFPETWSLVKFKFNGQYFHHPKWESMERQSFEELTGCAHVA